MRRAYREITGLVEIETILENANVCRIGLAEDQPLYIIPVFFWLCEGNPFSSFVVIGKKILEKNPTAIFEVD